MGECILARHGAGSGLQWKKLAGGSILHAYSGGFPDWASPEVDASIIQQCCMVKHIVRFTKAKFTASSNTTPSMWLGDSANGFCLGRGDKYSTVDIAPINDAFINLTQASALVFTYKGYLIGASKVNIIFRYSNNVDIAGEYEIWGLLES